MISLTRPRLKALFDAIGGEAGLTETLETFYARMASDAMLGFFFFGRNPAEIAGRQRDFMLRAMGVRQVYTGKPPGRAHTALPPIRRGMMDRRLTILREVLAARGLAPEHIETWVGFEDSFRDVVVNAPTQDSQ